MFQVWKICLEALQFANHKTSIELHAFVLMNNHYHLVISTPEANLDYFMSLFNKYISDEIGRTSGSLNRKFGGRYKWCLIESQQYYFNVLRYVFRNPMRANLVEKAEEYLYSSLGSEDIFAELGITIHQKLALNNQKFIDYVNSSTGHEDRTVKNALRRSSFRPALDRNTLKPRDLEKFPLF
jgi:putative transposase